MIHFDRALAAATSVLRDSVEPRVGEAVAIDQAVTVETGSHFVFFYDTVAYLEAGDVTHRLAGNRPIVVDRAAGVVRIAGSAQPWEQQLDD